MSGKILFKAVSATCIYIGFKIGADMPDLICAASGYIKHFRVKVSTQDAAFVKKVQFMQKDG